MTEEEDKTGKVDIAESRRILAAATERPWYVDHQGAVASRGSGITQAFPARPLGADGRAITHAVNTLPPTLDEIEAEDREIARLRELVETELAEAITWRDVYANDSSGESFNEWSRWSARACRLRTALTPEATDE